MSNLKFIQVGDSFNAIGLNVVWVIIGLITIYAGIKNLLDKENPSRVGTAVFWCSFGIVCGFGSWLPAKVSGALVLIMCLPPIFKKVKIRVRDLFSGKTDVRQYLEVGYHDYDQDQEHPIMFVAGDRMDEVIEIEVRND